MRSFRISKSNRAKSSAALAAPSAGGDFTPSSLFVAFTALPDLRRVTESPFRFRTAGRSLAALLSLGVLLFPMIPASRRVKNLEI